MLVLTRRVNESIVIGNDIVVTVLEIQRDAIRIGIKAPHDVEINREEIFQLLANKLSASLLMTEDHENLTHEAKELVDEQV